jgi:hypothetical protein
MDRRVSVTRTIEVPAPAGHVLGAVQNIKNIEHCEVKADAVTVFPDSDAHGWYAVRGHFAGVPWRGRFTYALNANGFHSHNEKRTVEGGFRVEPLRDDHCVVAHYEEYVLARWLVPLRGAIRQYLRWSMSRELEDLAALATSTS